MFYFIITTYQLAASRVKKLKITNFLMFHMLLTVHLAQRQEKTTQHRFQVRDFQSRLYQFIYIFYKRTEIYVQIVKKCF